MGNRHTQGHVYAALVATRDLALENSISASRIVSLLRPAAPIRLSR